jgi:putative aminopeptidase FrvX
MPLPALDLSYLRETLTQLLLTPSPVGYTEAGTELCRQFVCAFEPQNVHITRKGVLVATFDGQTEAAPRAVTAHIDTLGAVVKFIKPNGRLQLAPLGTFSWGSVENESVTLVTDSGQEFRGSIQVSNSSHHLYTSGDGDTDVPRQQNTMQVRLDVRAESDDAIRELGIDVGDFVCFDPRPEWNNGFIRSRHIDDKALLACLFTAFKALHDAKLAPVRRTTVLVSNYEEVGHGGASGFPADVEEVLALDVAPLGDGQNSDEYSVTLCARDADGPYDITMRRHLKALAKEHGIALKMDTFPEYCSDGDALWKAGMDARVALIGPGVDATHGIERTHIDALEATTKLVLAYLLSE